MIKSNKKLNKKLIDNKNVSRDDIKNKMGEINVVIDEIKSSSTDTIKVVAIIGIGLLVGIAFFSGRRRAMRPKTLINIEKYEN